MNAVWRESQATGRARLVLLAIADHQGEIGAWPSIATLARMVNASERSVQRDIQELADLGELEVHVQQAPSRGQYKANLYWVRLPSLGATSGVTKRTSGVTNRTSGVTDSASGVTARGALTLIEPLQKPNKTLVQNEFEPEPENFSEDDEFKKFWDIYPRRQGKGKARKAFREAFEAYGQVVLDGATRYASDPNLPLEKQYIPLPATWLNQERWDDEPLPERELTPEQKKAQAQADYERNRVAALRASEEQMAEYRRVAEEAAKNPPKRCEHDRVAVMCRTCGPKVSTT